MKALIHKGKVVQVENDIDVFPVAPGLKWIVVPAGKTVAPGHSYSGGVFVAPVVKPVAAPVKSDTRAVIDVLIGKGVLTRAEIDAAKVA